MSNLYSGQCPIGTFLNGNVTRTSLQKAKEIGGYLQIVRYKCHHNFYLVGNAERRCDPDNPISNFRDNTWTLANKWTGSDPNCIPKGNYLF